MFLFFPLWSQTICNHLSEKIIQLNLKKKSLSFSFGLSHIWLLPDVTGRGRQNMPSALLHVSGITEQALGFIWTLMAGGSTAGAVEDQWEMRQEAQNGHSTYMPDENQSYKTKTKYPHALHPEKN